MNETKEMISEIKEIIDSEELSKEDIETLKQTLAMLKANTEKSIVEDLVDGREKTVEVLKEKAEELSSALDREKSAIQTTTPTANELALKEAKIDSLQDALIKVVGMRDSMSAGQLKDAVYNLLSERNEEVKNLVEPCIGSIFAESGINFSDFSDDLSKETINKSEVGSLLSTILIESESLYNIKDAVFEAFANSKVKEQIMKCYEIQKKVKDADEELVKEVKNSKKLQEEIKRLELMQKQKKHGINPSMLTETGKEKLKRKLDELNEQYEQLEVKRQKMSKNLFLEIIFSKKLERTSQEQSKLIDSKNDLRQKLRIIEEIQREAIKIGNHVMEYEYDSEPAKSNLQEYIEYASKINPDNIGTLLAKKNSEMYDYKRGITIAQNQKYKESCKAWDEYSQEKEKLPIEVRKFIENRAYERYGFNPLKLLVTQDKEVISSLLVGTAIFNRTLERDFKDKYDVYQIAEKYNEVKARHEARKQVQGQIINNQNTEYMQAEVNIGAFQNNPNYIEEFAEEESQGMRM